MPDFEVKEIDGTQMVKELQSEVYFYTLEAYAKLSGCELRDIEQKAREAVENNPGAQVSSKYEILDLGIIGNKDIRGRYLIPAELAFYWLMTDCRTKAMLIGSEALAEETKAQFKAGIKPIEVYAPHNHASTRLAIVKLKAHYVSDDRSWRFPLSMLSEVVEAFLEGDYHYSEAFKRAVASAISPPRVDLLRDEHPERCIVISGFTNADKYFKCKVSHLDGVYNESDNTWRFCLDTLPLLLAYFPSPDYTHSEALLNEFKPIQCGF